MFNLQLLLSSIKLNYKTWLASLGALYIIAPDAPYYSKLLTFVVLLFLCYYFHYQAHLPDSYPLNITHVYHHNHHNFFSHFIQAVLEYISLFAVFFWKVILEKVTKKPMRLLNEWVIVFAYFFYSSVHNINYSIFHVNHVHENHHKLFRKNLGPDICDIAFGSKEEKMPENTDHYLYNIAGSTLAVYLLRHFYNKSNRKQLWWYTVAGSFGLGVTIVGISTLVLYIQDRYKLFSREYYKNLDECQQKESIIMKQTKLPKKLTVKETLPLPTIMEEEEEEEKPKAKLVGPSTLPVKETDMPSKNLSPNTSTPEKTMTTPI